MRIRFLNKIDKSITFLLVVFGSAVFADAIKSKEYGVWIGLGIAVLGAIQLVYDPRSSCVKHELFRRSYHDLLSKFLEKSPIEESNRILLNQEVIKISSDEPPAYKVLELIAYNRAIDALKNPKQPKHKILWYYRWIANLFAFENYAIQNGFTDSNENDAIQIFNIWRKLKLQKNKKF